MARWRSSEYFADVIAESVLLTTIADDGPAGFEQIHPSVWSATAPLPECEVFERVFTAELDGVAVRLLRAARGPTELLVLSDDPAIATQIGAGLVEPGVYEIIVDASRLTNLQGVENQLTPTNQ
jgi:hypothetical protein